MYVDCDERPRLLAEHIISQNGTVRSTAKAFGISKSTVHKDLTSRLKRSDPALWTEVSHILEKNKSERHLRGGNATRLKYESARLMKN